MISSKRDQNIIPVSGEKFKRIGKDILRNSMRQYMCWIIVKSDFNVSMYSAFIKKWLKYYTCKKCEDEVNRKGHFKKLQEAVHVDNVKYIIIKSEPERTSYQYWSISEPKGGPWPELQVSKKLGKLVSNSTIDLSEIAISHRPSILASVFFNCPEKSLVLFFSTCQYKVMAKTSRTKIRAIFYFWPLKRFRQK